LFNYCTNAGKRTTSTVDSSHRLEIRMSQHTEPGHRRAMRYVTRAVLLFAAMCVVATFDIADAGASAPYTVTRTYTATLTPSAGYEFSAGFPALAWQCQNSGGGSTATVTGGRITETGRTTVNMDGPSGVWPIELAVLRVDIDFAITSSRPASCHIQFSDLHVDSVNPTPGAMYLKAEDKLSGEFDVNLPADTPPPPPPPAVSTPAPRQVVCSNVRKRVPVYNRRGRVIRHRTVTVRECRVK
jgi:hypothetical protein